MIDNEHSGDGIDFNILGPNLETNVGNEQLNDEDLHEDDDKDDDDYNDLILHPNDF